MSRLPRFLPRLTATVTASALCLGLGVVSPALAQAGTLDQKTTFLGVEGEGTQVSNLADALRWELTQRGRDDGRNMSLDELRLTMGCSGEDVPCFAEGGKTLGSEELVYGSMTSYGKGFKVDLKLVVVSTGEVKREIERDLSAGDLADAALANTASDLLDALYEAVASPEDQPPAPSVDEPFTDLEPETEGPKEPGALIWGPYQPRAKWKYAGVGVMAGLTVGALGAGIGLIVAAGPNGKTREDLLAAAAASLEDDRPSNDVNPNSDQDLCALAQTPPDPNMPSQVTNAAVTEVCVRAERLADGATASFAVAGVFAVGTAAFTTLLFVHRDSSVTAKLREHQVLLSGSPLHGGGFMLGGSAKF